MINEEILKKAWINKIKNKWTGHGLLGFTIG